MSNRNIRLAHLVASARILHPPLVKNFNGVERVIPTSVRDSEDAFFRLIEEVTQRGMRRPLMNSLEALLWGELEEARAEANASIRERIQLRLSKHGEHRHPADGFDRLYRDDLRLNPPHFWALLAGGAITVFQNFHYGQGRYSPEEFERQIRETLRSEYCDALLPGFESYRHEREKAQRRRKFFGERRSPERIREDDWIVGGTAVPFSCLRGGEEDEGDFADRAEWLAGHGHAPSQRHLIQRLAAQDSLGSRQWAKGLLYFSFDGAFLDRLKGANDGWARKRKERLLKDVKLTARAEALLAAQQTLDATIAAQDDPLPRVGALTGRSYPGPRPIPAKRAKEILMQQPNGFKPGGWRVWCFQCYPRDSDLPQIWWAAQNGGDPIYAPDMSRLIRKIRAVDVSAAAGECGGRHPL